MSSQSFSIADEQRSGRFQRQDSAFRDRVSADGSSGLPAVAGRYHLYAAKACPWAHRTLIVRRLKGLEDAIGVSWIHPFRDARGWAMPGGAFTDELNGFHFLAEAYERSRPGFDARVTVPVLWDTQTERIVNNESADLVRDLGREFDAVAGDPGLDLYPEPLREEIDALNERIYATVNNGVYRTGFATTGDAYREAFAELFATLDMLEERLGDRRYLLGDERTEADWRLFVTLLRFDAVYHGHFKCNLRRIVDYPNLWGYTRDLFQVDGVAETVDLAQIKAHYYGTHPSINPTGIVPVGPDIDFTTPHGRD
jgi:putative glutathione S-transferase